MNSPALPLSVACASAPNSGTADPRRADHDRATGDHRHGLRRCGDGRARQSARPGSGGAGQLHLDPDVPADDRHPARHHGQGRPAPWRRRPARHRAAGAPSAVAGAADRTAVGGGAVVVVGADPRLDESAPGTDRAEPAVPQGHRPGLPGGGAVPRTALLHQRPGTDPAEHGAGDRRAAAEHPDQLRADLRPLRHAEDGWPAAAGPPAR